jgi:formate/nitrite transporter FocA (FNT family)
MEEREQRESLGDSDFDIEDALLDEAVTTVVKGAERLNRKWPELIITGLFGGFDVSLGILAMLLVKQATDSDILAGMAFGVGLLALKLAHSELFTEEFLLPLNAVIAGQGTWMQMLRLWTVTLVTNLLGGLAFMAIVVIGLPDYHRTLIDSAVGYIEQPSLPVMIALALLAGATITLSTRMQQGSSDDVVAVVTCMVSGLLVIGLGMLHGALNAIIIFGAMLAGADISIGAFAQWFAIVIPCNMLGGLLIISLPRVARTLRVLRGIRTGSIPLESAEEQAG